MVLRRKFSAHHFMEDVRLYNVTVMQYIGELCRYILTVPEVSQARQWENRKAFFFPRKLQHFCVHYLDSIITQSHHKNPSQYD